jgi:hypothetical protein
LRGFESELEGGLEGGGAEVSEQVADLLLAGVDDLPGGGLVDGVGHVAAERLETASQLFEQVLGGELGLAVHGGVSLRRGRMREAQQPLSGR